MAILTIIYILVFIIFALIAYAILQIKMFGMKIKDFWSFIEANQMLDKLYKFARQYENMSPQEQIIYLTEAEKIFKDTLSLVNNIPVVIDADGLNILAKKNIKLPEKVILTPHPKEASRLLACSLDEVLNDMEAAAKAITQKYNCVTVLKSHRTIVTDGVNIYHNVTGNSALAKAGSGDVLAGMIAGLLAQEMNIYDASVLGVYLHGLAGDLAKNDLTAYGVLASDTIRYISNAIKIYLYKS